TRESAGISIRPRTSSPEASATAAFETDGLSICAAKLAYSLARTLTKTPHETHKIATTQSDRSIKPTVRIPLLTQRLPHRGCALSPQPHAAQNNSPQQRTKSNQPHQRHIARSVRQCSDHRLLAHARLIPLRFDTRSLIATHLLQREHPQRQQPHVPLRQRAISHRA